MDGHKNNMDVGAWQDSPPASDGVRSPSQRFLSPTFIGILGTLLVHALVIQSLPFGRGLKTKPPETRESEFAFTISQGDPETGLVLINLSTAVNPQQSGALAVVTSLPDLAKLKIKSPITVDPSALLETLALSEEQPSNAANASGDGAERTRLLGIYTGQIQARIDRIWRRPRSPVNEAMLPANPSDLADSFQCEAQIVQDVKGNVQEILLPRCNGSPAWRRSLVLAIQQASPLPAPPDPKVFSESVTLNFVGLSYSLGSSEYGYELQARRVDQEK